MDENIGHEPVPNITSDDNEIGIWSTDADGNRVLVSMGKPPPKTSFSLTTKQMVKNQKSKAEYTFGASLVPLSVLTGSRTNPPKAPPSKRAKAAIAKGKPKVEFKVTGGKFNNTLQAGGNYNNGRRFGKESGAPKEKVLELLAEALSETVGESHGAAQIAYTIVLAVHKRDIEEGSGERTLSYWLLLELYHKYPETLKPVIKLVAEKYGSFLDLNHLADLNEKDLGISERQKLATELKKHIVQVYCENIETGNLLAAKWAPRIGKYHDRISGLGRAIAKQLYGDNKKCCEFYRKKLAAMQAAHPTIEMQMAKTDPETQQNVGWIEMAAHAEKVLTAVPGRAMSKYRKAFLDEFLYGIKKGQRRHPDSEARTKIRETLTDMTERMIKDPAAAKDLIKGSKTMQPHEIIKKVLPRSICGSPICTICDAYFDGDEEDNKVCEAQFAGIVQRVRDMGSLESTVVMADTGAHMWGIPMWVSLALALIISQSQSSEEWKDRFMVFSSIPAWHQLSKEDNLREKLKKMQKLPAHGSSDIQAAFDLILKQAKAASIAPSDMPKTFIILTGMNFKECMSVSGGDELKTHIQQAREKFKAVNAEYELPVVILWNLRSDDIVFQSQTDETGVIMLGGFSVGLLKSILGGEELDLRQATPHSMLMQTLQGKRYHDVHDAIANSAEGDLRGYAKYWKASKTS